MRSRAVLIVLVLLSASCKHDNGPKSVSDQSKIPRPPPEEPIATIEACYAGTASYGTSEADLAAAPHCDRATEGCMDPQPVVVRRTATPEHATIIEEWAEGPTESTSPTSSVHGITVSDSTFTFVVNAHVNPLGAESERKQLSWTGEGELTGEPWRWTAWTYTQVRQAPVTDVVTVRVEGDVLHRDTAVTANNGSVVLLQRDQLHEFPCSEWDARRETTLSAPPPK